MAGGDRDLSDAAAAETELRRGFETLAVTRPDPSAGVYERLVMQEAHTAIERCRKPVIAAVHGACVGGGVNVVAACDIRCCSRDATFVLKEVDMAIVVDLGALQRLHHIVGYGNAADLTLTGCKITAIEATEMGLVSRVFDSKKELDACGTKLAKGATFTYCHCHHFLGWKSGADVTATTIGKALGLTENENSSLY